MNEENRKMTHPSFRPTLERCVGRDPVMAQALGDLLGLQLCQIARFTYRSLCAESGDESISDLFHSIAAESLDHLRLLGRLTQALGGNPILRIQGGSPPQGPREPTASTREWLCRMLSDSIREKRCEIDMGQTVMGKTRDRVVRSLISAYLADLYRQIEALQAAMK